MSALTGEWWLRAGLLTIMSGMFTGAVRAGAERAAGSVKARCGFSEGLVKSPLRAQLFCEDYHPCHDLCPWVALVARNPGCEGSGEFEKSVARRGIFCPISNFETPGRKSGCASRAGLVKIRTDGQEVHFFTAGGRLPVTPLYVTTPTSATLTYVCASTSSRRSPSLLHDSAAIVFH